MNDSLYNKLILRCLKEKNKFSLRRSKKIKSALNSKFNKLLSFAREFSLMFTIKSRDEHIYNIINVFLTSHFNLQEEFFSFLKNNNIYDNFINEYLKNPYGNLDELHPCDYIYNSISLQNTNIDVYIQDDKWNIYLLNLLKNNEKK